MSSEDTQLHCVVFINALHTFVIVMFAVKYVTEPFYAKI